MPPIKIICKISAVLAFILLAVSFSSAQNTAVIYGTVKDTTGAAVPAVNVSVLNLPGGISTDDRGRYELNIPADTTITIVYSFIGYLSIRESINLGAGDRREKNVTLKRSASELPPITIQEKKERGNNVTKINPKVLQSIPNPSGSFEAVLKTLPGVSSVNELSSQYSVRGGNFDENLVYVNDVEIYRPFLIRSGQQEGLSFINSALVSSINFSAGGFDAIYGDKLSSALDITYRRPTKFAGSADLSLLGASAHVEGISKNLNWTYLFGIRQKSNQYILGSLDTEGEYKPSFTDLQTLITRSLGKQWELAFLGNYSRNKYNLIPQSRETEFGTVNQALKLRVFFDGQELDEYESGTGAITTTFRPNNDLNLKLIFSGYRTVESEAFDILGQYYLDELERDLGSDNFGEVAFNIGVGGYLEHARNELEATVLSSEHKGSWDIKNRNLKWGLRFQREMIDDKIKEWTVIDSADYSIPQQPDTIILFPEFISTSASLNSNRISGYLQNSWYFSDTSRTSFTAGIRANYWDINEELIITPRLSINHRPRWAKNLTLRAAAGLYYQPPFYRELRDREGNINLNVTAQRSKHFVIGGDYYFLAWGREFKFVTEFYYKDLDNLVPYKIENVRVRYLGDNLSSGYSTGADFRINGEFVPGLESWFSLSFLQTKEDLKNDFFYTYFNSEGVEIVPGFTGNNIATDSVRTEPGLIPRPTDQRVNFSIFFQDYLPKWPSYRVHITTLFGTGLPFGPPGSERYKDILRFPSYRRVDVGFSKVIIDEDGPRPERPRFAKHFRSLWVSLDVFNLLQINNTISYLWVRDVTGRQYAVPNYLTSRQLNFRIHLEF
ncbi:MAG: TonB-dependent receptor [Bacteroidia bacterium]